MTLFRAQVASHLASRLWAVTELEQKLANLKAHETSLKKEIMAATPQELRVFVENEGIIDTIMQWGRCAQKVRFGKDAEYFKSYSDAVAKIKLLQKAWKEVISIRLETQFEGDETCGRTGISFSPVQL